MCGAFAIVVVYDTSFVYNQYIDMDAQTYDAYVEEVLSRSVADIKNVRMNLRSAARPNRGQQK